jgi:hypothetical protein
MYLGLSAAAHSDDPETRIDMSEKKIADAVE